MKINIPMRAEARGEGELIRLARNLQLPNLGEAVVDGDSVFGMLRTAVRAGGYKGVESFIGRLKQHGFYPIEGDGEGQCLFHKLYNTTVTFVRQGSRIVIQMDKR